MSDPANGWEYLPADSYKPPSGAGDGVPRRRSGWLRRRLRSLGKPVEANDADAPGLDALTRDRLERLTPELAWTEAAAGLAAALGGWGTEGESGSSRLVIGPPGSGNGSVVETLARQRQWPILGRGPLARAPREPAAWCRELESVEPPVDGTPLAVPRLERAFLRHPEGLASMRSLLDRLASWGAPVLAGCDSWAWEFLRRTVGLADLFAAPLALAPFDGVRLDRWLGEPFRASPIECREVGSGEPVFAPEPPGGGGGETSERRRAARVLEEVAAEARGVPGVALALWSRSLGSPPGRADEAGETSLWAERLSGLRLPDLPPGAGAAELMTLHALLLHGGLSRDDLASVLPLEAETLRSSFVRLVAAGVVEPSAAGRWRVALLAYPHVRADLKAEGFLVDAF